MINVFNANKILLLRNFYKEILLLVGNVFMQRIVGQINVIVVI